MISTTESRGKSPVYDNIQSQWMYNALQHEIKYDVQQSPIHPFQIKNAHSNTLLLLSVGK